MPKLEIKTNGDLHNGTTILLDGQVYPCMKCDIRMDPKEGYVHMWVEHIIYPIKYDGDGDIVTESMEFLGCSRDDHKVLTMLSSITDDVLYEPTLSDFVDLVVELRRQRGLNKDE